MLQTKWIDISSRYGWILALLAIALASVRTILFLSPWLEAAKFLALFAFTISWGATESRLGWPHAIQRPLVGVMWVLGSLLMFTVAFLAHPPLFETVALLFSFAVALKGVGDWFGPRPKS